MSGGTISSSSGSSRRALRPVAFSLEIYELVLVCEGALFSTVVARVHRAGVCTAHAVHMRVSGCLLRKPSLVTYCGT